MGVGRRGGAPVRFPSAGKALERIRRREIGWGHRGYDRGRWSTHFGSNG